MQARCVNNWNIIKIVETGEIGIVRNDCLPLNSRGIVCVQFADKTAKVIEEHAEVELYKDLPTIVYDALKSISENA